MGEILSDPRPMFALSTTLAPLALTASLMLLAPFKALDSLTEVASWALA